MKTITPYKSLSDNLSKLNITFKECQHIFKVSDFAREKKCLKCGFITRDFGIIKKYK